MNKQSCVQSVRAASKNVRNKKLTDLEAEILILEVRKRNALWDLSLPLERRSRETVRRLWDEVSKELNGKLNAAEAKKKFKTLRDTHRKIIHTEQHASGPARIEKKKWRYYYLMEFLHDSCLIRPTQTNVTRGSICGDLQKDVLDVSASAIDSDTSNDVNEQLCSPTSGMRQRSQYRAKDTDDTVCAINRITDAMCREELNTVIPASVQSDEVDSMLHAAGLQLRRMPYRKRMQTLLDIMRMVHTRLMEEMEQTDT